jgi:hypothetical protein
VAISKRGFFRASWVGGGLDINHTDVIISKVEVGEIRERAEKVGERDDPGIPGGLGFRV